MSKKIIGNAVKGEREEILTLLLKLIVDHTIPNSKTTVFYKNKRNNMDNLEILALNSDAELGSLLMLCKIHDTTPCCKSASIRANSCSSGTGSFVGLNSLFIVDKDVL